MQELLEKDTLILADLHPLLDEVLPAGALVLRCQDLQLQPYDGCMRSILYTVYARGLKRIVVLGCAAAPERTLQEYAAAAGVSAARLEAVAYMLQHVHSIAPAAWLGKQEQALERAVALLEQHPLLPAGVQVVPLLHRP